MTTNFTKGDRVRLVHHDDPFTDLKPGELGTVTHVSQPFGLTTVNVQWDCRSTLAMLIDEGDVIEKVEPANEFERGFREEIQK